MKYVRRILLLSVCLLLPACTLPHWPVEGPVTSSFGVRWMGFWPEIHEGIDIAVPRGTPVRAMDEGRVLHAGWLGGYGLAVILAHGPDLTTVYAHLSEVRVEEGDEVRAHEVIALSGQSGNATGPHLHFEIWQDGQARDPVPLLGGMP